MPLINEEPKKKPTGTVSNSSVPQEDIRKPPTRPTDTGSYKSANINTRQTPLSSIISHIRGFFWSVDYYNNIVDLDDETSSFDISTDKVYQSYNKVVGLELRVQQALTPNFQLKQGEVRLGGTSIIVGGVRPNVNNILVADIGDGRRAIFEVMEVECKTHLSLDVFEIKYQLKDYLTPEIDSNLQSKVIKTWYYSTSDLLADRSPLLTASDIYQRGELDSQLSVIVRHHLMSFVDRDTGTLVIPNSKDYDLYMPDVVKDLYPTEHTGSLPLPITLNCADSKLDKITSLWDMLLNNSIEMMPLCSKHVAKRATSTFDNWAAFASIAYSGLDDVYYPTIKEAVPFEVPKEDEVKEKVDIHPVHHEGSYILSKWFYEGNRNLMSKLELLLWRYLNREALNPVEITDMCHKVFTWTEKERFYYIPMLVILIQICIRSGKTEV